MHRNTQLNSGKIFIRLSDHAYCPVCQKLVRLVGFKDAAALFKTDEDDIVQQAESLTLHRVHNRRGKVMICTDSLFRCFNECETRPLKPLAIAMAPSKAR